LSALLLKSYSVHTLYRFFATRISKYVLKIIGIKVKNKRKGLQWLAPQ